MRRTARYAVLLAGVLSLGLPGTAEAEHPPPQRTGQTWTAGTVTITETTTAAANTARASPRGTHTRPAGGTGTSRGLAR